MKSEFLENLKQMVKQKMKGKPSSKRKGNLNTETRTFNHPRKDVFRGREH